MRRLLRVALTLSATSVALAACSDRQQSTPTAPTRLPTAVPAVFSTVCNTSQLRSDARDLAASNQDILFTIIGNLQTSINQNGLNPTATDLAFDGLARLAAMRGTSAIKSTATGAAFNAVTRGFIGCMEQYITQTVDNSFDVSGALGSGWLYEVRGKASDGSGGAYERGASPSPYWAAEAQGSWGSAISAASQAKRFLIYGFRDPSFVVNDTKVGSAFDIKTVPVIGAPVLTLQSPLLIGLCNFTPATTVRVQHVSTVLAKQNLTCADPPTFALESSGFRSLNPFALAQRAIDLLTPKPAYAFGFGGVGGAVSELSPSAVIDMQNVVATFVSQPTNGFVRTTIPGNPGPYVRVLVTTAGGTPLVGATVTITVAGNSGTNVAASGGVETTDANGIATFDELSVNKAGGYTLTATPSFDGVGGPGVVSNLFNIQNK